MATTIEQQTALDESLVPSTQRAFQVTANVPEIYMQEFWATAKLHHNSIHFKIDTRKSVLDLEAFREMLHISPRIPNQPFADLPTEEEILDFPRFLGHSHDIRYLTDVNGHITYLSESPWSKPPFEEEILAFIRFLGHNAATRMLTDVNINKLYQPWRSFATLINKCLTGKSSGYDSLRLSQAQILWGLYHKRNIYYAYLMWEDFVYQVEQKNQKKSNEMYYPRFTKAIIHHFMSKASAKGKQTEKASKAKSQSTFSKVAMTEAQQLKLVTKQSKQQTHISQPSGSGADEGTDDEGSDNKEQDDDGDKEDEGDDGEEGNGDDDDEDDDGEKGNDDDADQEVIKDDDKDDDEDSGGDEQESNEETREEESFDPIPQTPESSEDEGDGMESIFETTSQLNVPTPTFVAPLPITTPTMTSSTIATTTTTSQAPILPTIVSSDIIQNLPSFGSLFHFDDRLRSLEENFFEVVQTNQFAGAVSAIPEIVQHYMDQRTNEAVKVAVQIQSDRLCNEAQRENEEFLRTVDENIKKIIKEQVKEQVKVQVSKILLRIEHAVNEQLEAEVLTRSSHSSRTSYAVAADLFEMELKKILIEKIKGNKSIQHSDEQKNLYRALVDAYESDKIILDTYGETVTLKRRRDDDEDKDEEPSGRPDRGSKRHREGKDPESVSTPSKTASKSAGRSIIGFRSRQVSTSESALAEEPEQTTSPIEEPSHLEFDTGVDDQLIVLSSQHPEWFSQQQKPPTLDRAWNKTLPAVHESIQPWISEMAKQADSCSTFNELIDTPLDFSNFLMNRLRVDTLTPELLAGPTY
nr:hypothetical protein [Tanacetum cinerariifolium]